MNRRLIVALVAALLLVPTAPLVLAAATLTMQIGPKYYNAGDDVAIKGTAPAGASVHININATSGSVFTADVTANSTGAYASTYELPTTAPIGIYKITATTGNSIANAVFMVTSVSTKDMAQSLIDAATKSQILVQETIQGLKAKGYPMLPAVNAGMTQGAEALERAETLLTAGSFVPAAESAQRAMNHFKNALVLALKTARVEENMDDHRQKVLEQQAEKLTNDAERLTEVLDNLEAAGKDVSAMRAKVAEAVASLATVETLIGQGKYDEATTAIKAARDSLQEAMQLLKPLLQTMRKELMEKFRFKLQERLNATKGDLNNLKEKLMNTNTNAVMNRLGVANGLIKRAETRITSGQNDDAMDDLEEATNELNACLNEVEDSGYSQGMMQSNTIRAQIQVLQEMAEKLTEKGQDASAITAKIQELQSLLDEGLGMMQGGNVGGANKVFGDAEQKGRSDDMGMGGSHGKGNGKNG